MNAPTQATRTLDRELEELENEAIFILREAMSQARRPVLLFSGGKDSTVLAHLAARAFYPARPPMPLLHVDSTWEFREVLAFRDRFAREHGFELRVHANEQGRAAGINPFDPGDTYTSVMRTESLKQALDVGNYDVVFGGARRDEEKSRAKERVFSVRERGHTWNPRQQRAELWRLYNTQLANGQSLRVFPLSNWTEMDIWRYADQRGIALASLYFAAPRPVLERDGMLLVVDDAARMRLQPDDVVMTRTVRFRTLGCWPVTAAFASAATDLQEVVRETAQSRNSERQGRIGDREGGGSLERQKREGYF
ncbi:sulfate adenylyltransferase subunit CysD [Rhodanobacter sp. AS-Z3]|uniref:sulfate adenylyltransferase subunit CysD n=1 Tax=Rhodanobacter sp. AS-Z3 TaxID=3031330 RepID=UPI00247A700D|nr:sulfate adenylyltransferase subunit CysD [Rhodanobacter sp. AS-Z3]WEN15703.1 sulfate adenylyltransferase subunit CysD [Rhodanobacter sp. AS-Z3]